MFSNFVSFVAASWKFLTRLWMSFWNPERLAQLDQLQRMLDERADLRRLNAPIGSDTEQRLCVLNVEIGWLRRELRDGYEC